jgi:DNA polymerase/3'-5' exonuclease PolX
MSGNGVRYPREFAQSVADSLCAELDGAVSRCVVAGSLRRMKPDVGDVEIVVCPRVVQFASEDLFGGKTFAAVNLFEARCERLLERGVLSKRANVKGAFVWGEKNKLALHVATGVPVDLFAIPEECFWNYLVCRTGGKESNMRIATAAIRKGWKWNPYGPGFTEMETGAVHAVRSEAEVFQFVGLPYRKPEDRT